jgi:membrane protease subunit (stomatin/prohibitin family)
MGLFGRSREGGLLDVIRCDEPEYLVWKWRPAGADVAADGPTHRENAIRWGSSLRVREGELAVFVYPRHAGSGPDYILGPYDQLLHTKNLPVLADLLGLAYDGDSPFQAEIYFFNLAGNNQLRFGVPEFDIFDPRFPDLGVPCVVRGTLTFALTDYRQFIKLNQLRQFDLGALRQQIREVFTGAAKGVIAGVPLNGGTSVLQIERQLDSISAQLLERLGAVLATDFGIQLKRVDIGAIELDRESVGYQQLKLNTADQQTKTLVTQTDVDLTNLAENARIQRKEAELQVESRNSAMYQLDLQASVLRSAAQNLGGSGASLFTGLSVGGAMGQQLGGMMGQLGTPLPPPPPALLYHAAINGQQLGTFTLAQLRNLAMAGQFTRQHYVWREGMAAWEHAGTNAEVAPVFGALPPPLPA